ncbi:MAG TPA: LLM class F420-dependent oxidoreductase [Acidimicrobiales bacterium]|jgi:probable F420-dependent oxidoreductase|nr:LLM class F420-dependent oxidoreductase [Acidimicrobiales bacterium]
MQIGAIYPQSELATDPATVRAWVAGVEELGYRHVLVYDHVVGADPDAYPGWDGPYDASTTFHEPFVFYGFLAAITRLELVTGIIIAPQRQTALLAKQAAEVDILSEGRFRLGIGVGWNPVEYEALGQDFRTRGRRQEEQIGLLRRLWTERVVDHQGRFDVISGAGLAPLPVQRPIPIWMGAASESAYRRIGQLADGWFPMLVPGDKLTEAQRIIADSAAAAGRDPAGIAMEGRLRAVDEAPRHYERWTEAGATHLTVDTMRLGLAGLDEHLDALRTTAAALGLR